MRPCRATRAGTQAPPLPISIIFFHTSHTNKITIYAQSTQIKPTVSCAICPNEIVGANIRAQFSQAKCVGAVPVCPPERPRSGVSMPKIHALCVGNERWMRPCGATRAGTQAPPLPRSVIFFHAIPHKPNNYLRAIHPNDINHPHVIHPNETVGAVPMCPPERPRSGGSIPKIYALCAGNERWMRPCGATRAGTQAPPLPISTKPRGASLPHRGYTFDSAGLASATQPTLGNNASEGATPLGVVLFPPHCFLMSSPSHTHRGRKCIAHSRPHNSK